MASKSIEKKKQIVSSMDNAELEFHRQMYSSMVHKKSRQMDIWHKWVIIIGNPVVALLVVLGILISHQDELFTIVWWTYFVGNVVVYEVEWLFLKPIYGWLHIIYTEDNKRWLNNRRI